MEYNRLKTVLEQFSKVSVLVVGDHMVDEYIVGTTDRISPEAPVQVVEVKKESRVPGGAGNVVRNLASFTKKLYVAGVIGNDEPGNYLKTTFEGYGCDCSAMVETENRPTTRKSRVIADRQQILRFDREDKGEISVEDGTKLVNQISKIAGKIDVVVLSDYGKGCLTKENIEEIVKIFSKRFVPIIVDPKGEDYTKYRGVTLVTPNIKETELATGIKIKCEDDAKKAAKIIREKCGIESALITMSEKGMTLFLPKGESFHVDTEAREVFDVTGAGDTVVSFMALGLGADIPPKEAAIIANMGAGIVVGKLGTASVSAGELLSYVRSKSEGGTVSKILTEQELKLQIGRLKKLGKKIVFTNGVFDLIHVGHIKLFQKAKFLGDTLVVGINSDHSARELKGEGRPIIGGMERALIISAMSSVDYVVIYDELTPEKILEMIKPDILVKGSNYDMEDVVGKEIVESYGGKIELIKFENNISVTSLAQKIKNSSLTL